MNSDENWLDVIYTELGYKESVGHYLLTDSTIASHTTLSQLDWLEQARKLGASSIFFVRDFPTILFFDLDSVIGTDTTEIEPNIYDLFLQVWNTSRIPLFFVALPGEIRVYSAYKKPIQAEKWQEESRWLKRISNISEISELIYFSKSYVESGELFRQHKSDFNRDNRVDQWLLKNMRLLREQLERGDKSKREFVHALIGRSIFVRYLEDREILVEEYFADIGNRKCKNYIDILSSREDTYALFRKLRLDFNGDLFPLSVNEEELIGQDELRLLQQFLRGRFMGEQPDLLFWAYRFDIIPIELISNIYEEFYHVNNNTQDKGTHYTPTTLVDFVLAESLTEDRLENRARVLDPACGSGIFLVETFKRMVNFARRNTEGNTVSGELLLDILTKKVVGIDVNFSAIQVAAFSLYLAYLDFRNPPDIRANKQLPKLIYDPSKPDEGGTTLFHGNAFWLTQEERTVLEQRISSKKVYAGRAADIRASKLPLLPSSITGFDVIVGNPPWGADSSQHSKVAIQWCEAFRKPIGHKELSQCFLWRTSRLLKQDGIVALLVAASTLHKTRGNSSEFRHQWLSENKVFAVYNFSHVRKVFFQQAISPFILIFFSADSDVHSSSLLYVAVKRQALIEQLQAVIIDRHEMQRVRQREVQAKHWLWKTLMWGKAGDAELISELKDCYEPLKEFVGEFGYGYQVRSHARKWTNEEFETQLELPLSHFYENQPIEQLLIPIKHSAITSLGNFEIYKNLRLLIRRGIPKSGSKLGEIQVRLASLPFVFTDDIAGFRVDNLDERLATALQGILLSSLAKYYHFLTCSMWGAWHHKIHRNEHLLFPVALPENDALLDRIIESVKEINERDEFPTLFDQDNPGWIHLQRKLDDAVFDAYHLSVSQRDQVHDLCRTTLDFFYHGMGSVAASPPSIEWIEDYQRAFVEIWQERLAARGKELQLRAFAPQNGLLVGVAFELVDLGTAEQFKPIVNDLEWQRILRNMSVVLLNKRTDQIYIDRIVKELASSSILILKRAERRLWTRTEARNDAKEMLTEVFKREWQNRIKGA